MRYTADLAGAESDEDLAQIAFEAFATAHPHEAHEHDPERFWAFFHAQCPHLSREEMQSLLAIPA